MSDQTTRPPTDPANLRELLAPFDTGIQRVEVSLKYKLGLFFVAAAMMLLPLAYLALIALAGCLLFWHAAMNSGLIHNGSVAFVFLYLVPLFLGGVGFLCMFKPLFASGLREAVVLSLNPDEEPVLFQFVKRLCLCLNAPVPQRIDVNIEPLATGARFRRGFLSLLGHDMVLTIGLPMATGLTLREFTGVLAHELGYFTQGTALRFTYTIRRIHHWFLQAVFESDIWDERLYFASRFSRSLSVRALAYFARLFVFITRLALFALMFVGQIISSFMSRKMELHADRYEARIAGSETLESTELKLHEMSVAWDEVSDLQAGWFDGRLADDVPALIAAELAVYQQDSLDLLREIEFAVFDRRTGLFDTHPSPRDRIANARQENAEGIFRLEYSATTLFADFQRLCKAATVVYYQQMLGKEFQQLQVIDTALMVQEQVEQREAEDTLSRYFQGQLLQKELFLPEGWTPSCADPEESIRLLRQARLAMHAGLHRIAAALQRYEWAEVKRYKAFVAQLLHASNLAVDPAKLDLEGWDVVAIGRAQQEGWTMREQALKDLEEFVQHAETRLTTALMLLNVAEIAEKLDDLHAIGRTETLVDVLDGLRNAWSHMTPLIDHHFGLEDLLDQVQGNERNQAYCQEVTRVAAIVCEHMASLRDMLASLDYPFEHAEGTISVADYALPEIPEPEQFGQVLVDSSTMIHKLTFLYFRIMAHLAVTAEKVEAAIGLPRLPHPPKFEA